MGYYLPSEEEIKNACKLIQSEWSTDERKRRMINREFLKEYYTVPEVKSVKKALKGDPSD